MNHPALPTIITIIPNKFHLDQNYPNPFNPVTTIRFAIPEFSALRTTPLSALRILGGDPVTLKVYDILGKEIATLVNDNLSPGTYSAKFDGSSFSSGVYFYKFTAGEYSETKRMLLIK